MILSSTMALLGTMGCGTETGNPEGDVSVLYNARTRAPEVVSLEPVPDRTVVSAVWLRLDPVQLLANCAIEGPPVALGALGLADHGGEEAFLQSARIPEGPYCGLTTSFVPGSEGPTPETAGASVVIEGALADGRGFVVVVDEAIDVARELDRAVRPDDGAWLVSFDVGRWIDPAELSELEGDPVVVSSEVNPEALDAILTRVPAGVQLHHDRGIDGIVDPEDRRLDLP